MIFDLDLAYLDNAFDIIDRIIFPVVSVPRPRVVGENQVFFEGFGTFENQYEPKISH